MNEKVITKQSHFRKLFFSGSDIKKTNFPETKLTPSNTF